MSWLSCSRCGDLIDTDTFPGAWDIDEDRPYCPVCQMNHHFREALEKDDESYGRT